MGWADRYAAGQRQAQRQQDWERRQRLREGERERAHLEDLRMKALAEQAKGERGTWTAEYEGRLAAIRQREADRAKMVRGCAIAFAVLMGLGLAIAIGGAILSAVVDAMTEEPAAKPAPKPRARR